MGGEEDGERGSLSAAQASAQAGQSVGEGVDEEGARPPSRDEVLDLLGGASASRRP